MKPLVVLAHGTRTTKKEWDGYDELLPSAHVLPIDLPGHGDRSSMPCTFANVVAVFDEAVSSADADQPVVLVGHSLGGYLAAAYAAELARMGRDDLDGLVLVGTTANPASKMAFVYKAFAKLLPLVGFERMTTIANAMYRLLGEKGELPGPESYAALADAWDIVFTHCGPHNLADVRCPVVLVNGQFDQMRIHAKVFAGHAPDARRHIVRGATHLLPVTHAPALAGIIADLVAELDSERQSQRGALAART